MIEAVMKNGVVVLAMRHGKANALDTELYLAILSLNPAGRGRPRWTNRWKAAHSPRWIR